MVTRLTDFEQTFGLLDELRHQMNRVWTEYDDRWGFAPRAGLALETAAWPRIDVVDGGAELAVTAELPGLAEKDVEITLNDGVLSLRGARKNEAPQGYAALRRERGDFRFARSIMLPVKVDAEKTTATMKDGVLTVTLAKAPEARPRQIAIKAAQ